MKQVLGIDVGGSKIAAGLVDNHFQVSKVTIIPTSQTDLLGQIAKISKSYSGFGAIGLAVPGRVLADGSVRSFANIRSFKPTNLKKFLNNLFKGPVVVMNDAKAFALAEACVGAGKNYETVVGVVLGTGIGSGLIRNRQIYYGENRLAGEIGHIKISGKLTLEQLMQSAKARQNAKQLKVLIQIIISLIIRSVDPEIIIFGGGRIEQSGMPEILDAALKLVSKYPIKTVVRVSRLKHAAIIGAALSLLKK